MSTFRYCANNKENGRIPYVIEIRNVHKIFIKKSQGKDQLGENVRTSLTRMTQKHNVLVTARFTRKWLGIDCNNRFLLNMPTLSTTEVGNFFKLIAVFKEEALHPPHPPTPLPSAQRLVCQ